SNNLFGLSYFDPNTGPGDRPAAGHVGCATEVVEAQALPDGRSNILTVGLVRYRVAEYVERGDPYLVARVEFFEDEESDAPLLRKRADEVTEMFMRIARAMRTINDERGGLPELPRDDPERLSFLVAAVVRWTPTPSSSCSSCARPRSACAASTRCSRRPSSPTRRARARTSWRAA